MASSTNAWKPAQGVQLAPIKMSKSVAAVPKTDAEPAVKTGYRPPQARPKKDEPLDFGEQSFPSLGSSQAKAVATASDFKGKILNLIARDEMEEFERLRVPEADPFKMSAAELESAGYAILKVPQTPEERISFVKNYIERMSRFEKVQEEIDTGYY
jgi:hypothetical protein